MGQPPGRLRQQKVWRRRASHPFAAGFAAGASAEPPSAVAAGFFPAPFAVLAGHRLAVGVGCDRRDQGGAGAGRAGVDHTAPRRGRGRKPFGSLGHRRLQAGSEEGRRSPPVAEADAELGARPSSSSSLAGPCVCRRTSSSRRSGGEASTGASLSTVPSEGRSHAALSGKAALEQLRGLHRARGAGGGAEHHSDQPAAVARRGGDEIVAGGADEAGLETVGAGIAADQLVEILVIRVPKRIEGMWTKYSYSGRSRMKERARIARSRAEVIWPSAGRPFGLT